MEKVLEVQQNVKNNAADLNDYLRDLDNWTKQMEAKDEQLKKAKKNKKVDDNINDNKVNGHSNSTTTKNVKEEVNRAVKKENSSPPKKPKTESKGGTKIKISEVDTSAKATKRAAPRGYSEWDKFDVEAACEEVASSESETEGVAEEDFTPDTKKIEAVAEKERGNDWFKKGDYDKAIERYTKGMSLDPSNAMLPANRAMALLKKYQYAKAETDCTLALSIDSTYVKAYQRRASARTGLGKYDLAIGDYEQILKHEPSNKAAQNEKTKLVEKLKAVNEINEKPNDAASNFNKFDDKMKGAFKSKNVSPQHQAKSASSMKISSSPVDKNVILPIQKPAHLRSTKPLKRINIEEVQSMKKQNGNASLTEIKTVKGDVSKSSGITKKIEREISADLSNVEIANTIPPVPKISSKFLTDWKSLKTVVNRSKYLQQFKAADYVSVFKASLDGTVFSDICGVLHHMVQRGVVPEVVVAQMNGLSSLPRVAAVAMFASRQDMDKLRYVVEELDIASPADKEKWIKTFSLK